MRKTMEEYRDDLMAYSEPEYEDFAAHDDEYGDDFSDI